MIFDQTKASPFQTGSQPLGTCDGGNACNLSWRKGAPKQGGGFFKGKGLNDEVSNDQIPKNDIILFGR